jgi:Holliday junction resolvase RusA-like endonuclease
VNGSSGAAGAGGASGGFEGLRSLRIVAHGEPAAQGSKKHVGSGRMIEMSKKLPAWRAAVKVYARQAAGPDWKPIQGAVSIAGEIRLRKPKTTKYDDYPAGAPDLDKLQRAIGDALTQAGTITDDARIIHWCIRKVWATDLPGMDIQISEIGGNHGMHN